MPRPTPKIRPDSLYAKLTPKQRGELFVMLGEEHKGYDDALKLCSTWNVRTSRTGLSDFFSRHYFTWQLERAADAAELVQSVAIDDPERATQQLLAQKLFAAMAAADVPAEILLNFEALRLRAKELELDAERVEIAKTRTKAAEAVKEVGRAANLSDEDLDKILEAVDRRILGK